MDQQTFEFHGDIRDALRSAISKCGGIKVVASAMWPTKPPDVAARLLADQLNIDRPAKLGPDDLMAVLSHVRQEGKNCAFFWMCDQLGYTQPKPQPPEDELGELYAKYVNAVEYLARITGSIQTQESKLRVVE